VSALSEGACAARLKLTQLVKLFQGRQGIFKMSKAGKATFVTLRDVCLIKWRAECDAFRSC